MEKNKQLSEKDLNKVNGGFSTETIYSFDAGDCFSASDIYIVKVLFDYTNISDKTPIMCDVLKFGKLLQNQELYPINTIFDKQYYIGKNKI